MAKYGTGWKVDGSGYGYGLVQGKPKPSGSTPAATAVGIVVLVLLLAAGGFVAWHVHGSGQSPSVTVPALVGLDDVDAAQALERDGLTPNMVDSPAPPAQFGHVLRSDPSAGAAVARGATVTVYLGVVTLGS